MIRALVPFERAAIAAHIHDKMRAAAVSPRHHLSPNLQLEQTAALTLRKQLADRGKIGEKGVVT
jgi:hypothetical protein